MNPSDVGWAMPNITQRWSALPNGEATFFENESPIDVAVWLRSSTNPSGCSSKHSAKRRMIHVAVGPMTLSQ